MHYEYNIIKLKSSNNLEYYEVLNDLIHKANKLYNHTLHNEIKINSDKLIVTEYVG